MKNKYACILISLLLSFSLFCLYKSDLPVHCLSREVEGDWIIHISNNDNDKSIKCGHEHPDKNLDHLNSLEKIKDISIKTEVIIKIERPNMIYAVKEDGSFDTSSPIGKWTMIYDEGMELNFSDNVFFAFFRYEQTTKFTASNSDTEDTPGYKSLCNKTFLGWYHNKNNKDWGCYWAEKIDQNISSYNLKKINYQNIFETGILQKKSGSIKEVKELKAVKRNIQNNQVISSKINEIKNTVSNSNSINNNSENFINYVDFLKTLVSSAAKEDYSNNSINIPHLDIYFLNGDEESNYSTSNFLEHEVSVNKVFVPDYDYVNKINSSSKYLWKAAVYDEFVGKSYKSMRSLLGNLNFNKNFYDPDSSKTNNSFIELEESYSNTNKSFLSKLPKDFTWTNVDGANFDSPIKKQGECGSCYALAMLSIFESRLRIKTNNRNKTILSSSSVIGCSRTNQGCSGGYPYLVGKHGYEFGFVEEICQPYSEDDKTCKNLCYEENVYFAKNYGYVGDYYGGCNEEAMMEEIYNNGPIVVAINATPELYYYKTGIFHSDAVKKEGKLEKNVKPWEYTNHAVVAIGWGEEMINDKLEKYWILKNSWGEEWGEKGYFKISKGVNMASVEAQGVYVTPK